MKAALGVLETLSAKRRIAVLGSIGELGEKSEELHRAVGTDVSLSKTDVLITVGEDAKFIANEANKKEVYVFENTKDCADFLKSFLKKDDAVLVKASRFMKFETISQELM